MQRLGDRTWYSTTELLHQYKELRSSADGSNDLHLHAIMISYCMNIVDHFMVSHACCVCGKCPHGVFEATQAHQNFCGILKDLDAKIVHDLAEWRG